MSDPSEMQAFWDERYRTKGYVWGVDVNQFVEQHLSDLPPGRALDLGSGQGRNAVWLARQGHAVTAVDLSSVAAEQGARLAAEVGVDVDFVTADVTSWRPPAEAFDLVLLSYLQLPDVDRQKAHRAAVAALKPGGLLFLIAHHRDNLEHGAGGPQRPEVLPTEADLAADFADLDIELNHVVRRAVEVDGEAREAIDVMVVARKPV